MAERLSWLEERTGVVSWVRRFFRPVTGRPWSVALGSVLLLLIANQVVTGALLSVYYRPVVDGAHASVREILHRVPMGWFLRGLHVWGAHLLVAAMLLHLVRTFVQGTHRRPGEIVWVTGVLLFAVLLGSAFTGQALPLDAEGYSGLLVASGLASEWGAGRLLLGGDYVTDATMGRMFAVHAILLPLAILVLLSGHIALAARRQSAEPELPTGPPWFWVVGGALLTMLAALVTLAVVSIPGVGVSQDPAGVTPTGVKPAWYFLPFYQALKFIPPWLEPWAPPVGLLTLLLVPWWDRGTKRRAVFVLFFGAFFALVALGIAGAMS